MPPVLPGVPAASSGVLAVGVTATLLGVGVGEKVATADVPVTGLAVRTGARVWVTSGLGL